MASDSRTVPGMSMERLSITACVTPYSRSLKIYCNRNCTPTTAVALSISQRERFITLLLVTFTGNSSSFSVSRAIRAMAVNCISLINWVQNYAFSRFLPSFSV